MEQNSQMPTHRQSPGDLTFVNVLICCSSPAHFFDWFLKMAMYRLEAKIFSRGKSGRSVVAGSAYRTAGKLQTRSVVAGAAYRNGEKLTDERIDKTFDYLRRSIGVIKTKIIAPDHAPLWVFSSGKLWNRVEAKEK